MGWDGIERRKRRERRCTERRSAVNFSINMILNGSASRRAGVDRRNQMRRQEDRTESEHLTDKTSEKPEKPLGVF